MITNSSVSKAGNGSGSSLVENYKPIAGAGRFAGDAREAYSNNQAPDQVVIN